MKDQVTTDTDWQPEWRTRPGGGAWPGGQICWASLGDVRVAITQDEEDYRWEAVYPYSTLPLVSAGWSGTLDGAKAGGARAARLVYRGSEGLPLELRDYTQRPQSPREIYRLRSRLLARQYREDVERARAEGLTPSD